MVADGQLPPNDFVIGAPGCGITALRADPGARPEIGISRPEAPRPERTSAAELFPIGGLELAAWSVRAG